MPALHTVLFLMVALLAGWFAFAVPALAPADSEKAPDPDDPDDMLGEVVPRAQDKLRYILVLVALFVYVSQTSGLFRREDDDKRDKRAVWVQPLYFERSRIDSFLAG